MLQASYPIQTARLTLRPFCPDDLDDLYAIHSLPEVARYLYWEPRDMAEVRDVLDAKCRQSTLAQAGDRTVSGSPLAGGRHGRRRGEPRVAERGASSG